jgi:hypothetical protein
MVKTCHHTPFCGGRQDQSVLVKSELRLQALKWGGVSEKQAKKPQNASCFRFCFKSWRRSAII